MIGYRDSHMFLKEEFEAYGLVTVATEDGSVGTKGNVLDAIRENDLKADVIYACGPTPMPVSYTHLHSDASYTAKPCSEMLWINVQRVYHNQGGTI